MATEGPIVWRPVDAVSQAAQITRFQEHVERSRGRTFKCYADLWTWSVSDIEDFWKAVVEYFDVKWGDVPKAVLTARQMPDVLWFEGGTTNYVSQVFRSRGAGAALVGLNEAGDRRVISWPELERQVGCLAKTFRDLGVVEGDTIAGYAADVPEAIVSFLATASVGATWASCSQDLNAPAAAERFSQLSPKVLVASRGYFHRGIFVDRSAHVTNLAASLPELIQVIAIPGEGGVGFDAMPWTEATMGEFALSPVQVPASHPLWVLFSSGTTGLPKGIVHSHAGVIVEHLKTLGLHLDLDARSTFFWYTTLSWMMWNFRNSALLLGATVVCFDGTPAPAAIWSIAETESVTALGVSPGFLASTQQAAISPAHDYDLSALRFLGCTGSVLPADVHVWAANELGPMVVVGSTTGGTDIVSGFAGSVVTEPIVAGEIGVRCLAVDLQAWSDAGQPVEGRVGELVVLQPMPSMPVSFWADPDGTKYSAAYFEKFPGVWRHGDWITLTERGSLIVHGRSDATLNRNGVRMGSADIYRVAESIPLVEEALVVGIEEADGGYWMPMFVVLTTGTSLDDELIGHIRGQIRSQLSPRHVPDEIIQAPGIPHTLTGKKIEVPVKRLLVGSDGNQVQVGAVDRPDLLDWYTRVGDRHRRGRATR